LNNIQDGALTNLNFEIVLYFPNHLINLYQNL